MFERFTDRARRAVVLAQAEASDYGFAEVGTGHLLLGLAAEEGGIASLCLAELGLNIIGARSGLAAMEPSTSRPSGHIGFTRGLRKAMENALRESIQMGHAYIGTEHLLLGLLREVGGPSDQLLIAAGITPLVVRDEVLRRLGAYEQPRVTAKVPGLNPCKRCNGSGTEPEQPGMAAIRAYMTATGWEADPFPGTAGEIWHRTGAPHGIAVSFGGEPGSLECRSVIKRLAWAEGRGEPEIAAAIMALPLSHD